MCLATAAGTVEVVVLPAEAKYIEPAVSSSLISLTWSSWAFSFSIAKTSPIPPSSCAVKTDFTEAPNVVETILGKLDIDSILETSTVGIEPVSVTGRDRLEPLSVLIRQPAVLPQTVLGIALKKRVWLFNACHTFLPYVVLKIPVAVSTVKYVCFCRYSGPKTELYKPRCDCARYSLSEGLAIIKFIS